MTVIAQRMLRNEISDILRRAESGEEFTVTVNGRPVAQLGPCQKKRWVPREQLKELFDLPSVPTVLDDLRQTGGISKTRLPHEGYS